MPFRGTLDEGTQVNASMQNHHRLSVFKIVAIYTFIGLSWIYLSDTILVWMIRDPFLMKYIAISKGTLFVLITAALLYVLIRRHMNRLMTVHQTLLERELLLQSMASNIPGAMCQIAVSAAGEFKVSYVSARVKDIFGISINPDTFVETFTAQVAREDRERFLDSLREAASANLPWTFEGRFIKAGGEMMWFQAMSTQSRQEDYTLFYSVLLDITERKQAERLLRRRESDLAEAQRIAMLGSWSYDMRMQTVNWSDELYRIFGVEKKDFKGFYESFLSRVHPEDHEKVLQANRRAMTSGEPFEIEYHIITDHNEVKHIREVGYARKDHAGNVAGLFGTAQDITKQKHAEEALKESEDHLRVLSDHLADGMVYQINSGQDGQRRLFTYLSPAIRRLHGLDVEAVKENPSLLYDQFEGEYKAILNEAEAHAFNTMSKLDIDLPVRLPSGEIRWRRFMSSPRRHADGSVIWDGIEWDITDRKKDEEELQRFTSILRHSSEVISLATLDGKMIFLNETGCRMLGIEPDKVNEFNIRDVVPDPLMMLFKTELLPALLTSGTWEGELQYRNVKTGDLVDVYAMTFTIADPVSKVPLYLASVSRDISERKQAEAERVKLQEQLLQSQKLEAVGILAGGVAHDFNNILGAIIGYAEISMQEVPPENPLHQNLGKILDAAMRSSNIIRQLLAFARKQVIAPLLLDLNESVEGTLKMIRRLIGENIELAWLPGTGPGKVLMDPSQLDQILLNLCVNARDAIDGVGKVTIETDTVFFDDTYCLTHADIAPGRYVQLSISDTGRGMDKETQKHIFEPFFTTKAVGQGTGMGLATVYGAVKQNGGFIRVLSEPGKGTTFKIYIPLHIVDAPEVRKTPANNLPRSRGETVLVVEDDPAMLEMTKVMLQKLGYSVLLAHKPSEALRIAQYHTAEIHLFLTDVVMPEMNGRDLVQQVLAARPKIKPLFMSGYTADAIAHQCVLEEGVHFIQKPFLQKDLAVKIREALDG